MKKINITESEFTNLEYINLFGTWHTESRLYKSPFDNGSIIKIYKLFDDEKYMKEKRENVENLYYFSIENNIPELTIPTYLLTIDDEFRGIIEPKKIGKNASYYLTNSDTPIKVKIEILKQIGTILEKIHNTSPKYKAAFGDVHSDNFIVRKTKYSVNTYGIDTDSMKLYDINFGAGYYFCDNLFINSFEKYEKGYGDSIIPSYQTDIYSYIMMILEVIADDECIVDLDVNKYKKYIDYLDRLGFNSDLLKCFLSIYDNKVDNINPLPYLDSLEMISDESSKLAFSKHFTK